MSYQLKMESKSSLVSAVGVLELSGPDGTYSTVQEDILVQGKRPCVLKITQPGEYTFQFSIRNHRADFRLYVCDPAGKVLAEKKCLKDELLNGRTFNFEVK